ncbi:MULTISPECIES: oligoendopeptidase F [unclassified Mycoplasma]|uniref:oligoendopeptidase F n=1 Tax=unclassified Mycoplasma TaxID=2683645 RepID=UPI00211C4854|nr:MULTISPECIES: oligoendopeptidase F [unclassified Mycoplasma]UUM19499.1 oligoendopeptidase F [Mycoplasma sp. 1578d]UUM25122.1 oligoendopeptidase F [Mycoplasma sp. 3686d]
MKIKQYNKYDDIPQEYRFDLEHILQGRSIQELIEQYKQVFEQRIVIKDSKYNSFDEYLVDVKLSEQLTALEYRIENYISNHISTNVVNPDFKKLAEEFDFLNERLSEQFGSETNRFYQNIDKLKLWKEKNELKEYKHSIENALLDYEHKLSDEVEEFVQKQAFGRASLASIFSILTNSELDYGIIKDLKGKIYKLNPTNRVEFLKSNDAQLRKQAHFNYIKAFLKHKESLASLLYQHFKSITVDAKLRKFDSATHMLTYGDKVSDEVLNRLYHQVASRKNIFYKFKTAHSKFYQFKFKEKYHPWDARRELVKVKTNYSINEAKELVARAFEPFGIEYNTQIRKALNENWVDFMPAHSKRSGAYSIGSSYGIEKKYILMNFKGDLESVETLAHELGHSMHSYFSDTRQSIANSEYPIFLAEIASIFNELMLFDYLLQHSNNDKLKFQILNTMINGFIGTVMRQVEWSNYEYDLYKAIESGSASSSFKSLSQIYFNNAKKYTLVKNLKYSEINTFACIYVPHFYYDFYVYKYAIGQLVANYFFAQYKQNGTSALQNYIDNFLSAGGSNDPLKILEKVGVNLNSNNFYQLGFSYVENLINQYIKLGQKLFKK